MDNCKILNGKKFMWDGLEYESSEATNENFNKYKNDKFETEIVEENGKFYLFTRRLVTEIVLEGNAPT